MEGKKSAKLLNGGIDMIGNVSKTVIQRTDEEKLMFCPVRREYKCRSGTE
jgi:hypothetical protein